MTPNTRKTLRFGGAAVGTAAVATLSAFVTTKYLLRMALDREAPKLMKLAEKKVAGSAQDNSFFSALNAADKRLAQKETTIVRITSYDGQVLFGHWIPAANAKRIIIAVHGWRSSWTQAFGMVSDGWEENDCSVLYIEQRAQSNSGGDYMGFGLIERYDCLDWVKWVVSNCDDGLPIYLCGVSMGATTVLMTAGLELPRQVRGIIADCGYTSPRAIWKHVANNNLHIAFGLRAAIADEILKHKFQIGSDDYSTIDALRSSTIPVLLIHGSDDHFVPVEMSYENYKACAGPKRLLIVPGADHGMSYYIEPERYEAEVKQFWAECEA